MSYFEGFNKQYQKELQERIDDLVSTVCNGNFTSLDEYKLIVGKLSGTQFALDRHRELISLMENYDDDRQRSNI
jgi:hypothetical protein